MKLITFKRGAFLTCAIAALYALSLWCATSAFAATTSTTSTSTTASATDTNTSTNFESTPYHGSSTSLGHTTSGSLGGTVVRTIVGLLVVIAVIYGLTWFLRQTRSSCNPTIGEGLLPIASLALGPNRSVALVRVGAELHLIGVAEHGVTGIRVFTEEEAYELGIPYDPEDLLPTGRRGSSRGVVDSLRRFTIR